MSHQILTWVVRSFIAAMLLLPVICLAIGALQDKESPS
jgi:hypothetical protein